MKESRGKGKKNRKQKQNKKNGTKNRKKKKSKNQKRKNDKYEQEHKDIYFEPCSGFTFYKTARDGQHRCWLKDELKDKRGSSSRLSGVCNDGK